MLSKILTKSDYIILNTLIYLWLSLVGLFFVWWLRPTHVGTPLGFLLTTFIFVWAIFLPGYCFVFLLKMRAPNTLADLPVSLRVAIVVTKAPSEPFDIVKRTLLGALHQKLPHDTWVADEAPTEASLKWYKSHGVKVSTRKDSLSHHNDTWPRRKKCKEGNLAYFYDYYGYDNYDIVVQMDADHVPSKNYLENIVRPFADSTVGYCAAPSICDKNFSNSWASRARGISEAMFHGPIQSGSNDNWSPICIGSHYAVRTKALKEIGGIGPELAEDYSTTLLMNAHGWKGVWVYDAEARGLGPSTFNDLIVQDYQWSKSMFILLLTFLPKYFKKFSFRQKLQFVFSELWYPISALTWLLGIVLTLTALVTDVSPVNVNFKEFLSFIFPPAVATYTIFMYVRFRKYLRPMNVKLFSWENTLFELARWPWVLISEYSAVLTVIRRKNFVPKVTPKDKNIMETLSFSTTFPYLFVILSCLVAMYIGRNNVNTEGYMWFAYAAVFSYSFLILLASYKYINESEYNKNTQVISQIPQLAFTALLLLISANIISSYTASQLNQNLFEVKDAALATVEASKLNISIKSEEIPVSTNTIEQGPPIIFKYTVKAGDNLWDIAKRYYGDGTKWTVIETKSGSKVIQPNEVLVLKQ